MHVSYTPLPVNIFCRFCGTHMLCVLKRVISIFIVVITVEKIPMTPECQIKRWYGPQSPPYKSNILAILVPVQKIF